MSNFELIALTFGRKNDISCNFILFDMIFHAISVNCITDSVATD